MSHRDQLERNEILERWNPYWFDLCSWCGSDEGKEHEQDCDWQRIRLEQGLEIAA